MSVDRYFYDPQASLSLLFYGSNVDMVKATQLFLLNLHFILLLSKLFSPASPLIIAQFPVFILGSCGD